MNVHCTADGNPVEAWARDPKRVEKARALIREAHASGRTGVDGLQEHAIAHSWDPETVHLAVSIEWERDPEDTRCGSCGLADAYGSFRTCARCGSKRRREARVG